MKKIALSTLLLSSILYGSNNLSELEQAIKDSDFNALKTLLTKKSIEKNECARMADLSQQITSQRNKVLISPSWAKAVTLSLLAILAKNTTKKEEPKFSGHLESTLEAAFAVSIIGLAVTQTIAGAKALYKAYNARKVRNLLLKQQSSSENHEVVA